MAPATSCGPLAIVTGIARRSASLRAVESPVPGTSLAGDAVSRSGSVPISQATRSGREQLSLIGRIQASRSQSSARRGHVYSPLLSLGAAPRGFRTHGRLSPYSGPRGYRRPATGIGEAFSSSDAAASPCPGRPTLLGGFHSDVPCELLLTIEVNVNRSERDSTEY